MMSYNKYNDSDSSNSEYAVDVYVWNQVGSDVDVELRCQSMFN